MKIIDYIYLIIVGLGVQHYTGHLCIAIATQAALLYLRN